MTNMALLYARTLSISFSEMILGEQLHFKLHLMMNMFYIINNNPMIHTNIPFANRAYFAYLASTSCTTQPNSHYIRYTAASVLRSTTLSTPEGHWLTCAW